MSVKTKVLIIGAGPTGLMAACLLQKAGVDFIIIDKKEGPTVESRALVVHSRSLEIYDHLGLANIALLQGEIIEKVQLVVKQKKVQEIKLGRLGEGISPFPFLLVLEQSKNEGLLFQHLEKNGGRVFWNTELTSVVQDEHKVLALVDHAGEPYDIEAEYVIAADGASSTVRKDLNIPFVGDTYQHIFYVADTKLEGRQHDKITLQFSEHSLLGLFPMQGKDRYRMLGVLPAEYQDEKPSSFDDLIPVIEKDLNEKLHHSETNWFSVYRLHHRCIEKFRRERIFFAGDSAHIHSPAGGQGMNTGLQDAYNLCWKLGMVAHGMAADHLLDTYEQERLPVAKKLLHSTDRAFSIGTASSWYMRFLRMQILPVVVPFIFRMRKWRLRIYKTLSQTGIRYINSDLTVIRMAEPLSVKAGERLPFLKTNNEESVFDMLTGPFFHALVFGVTEEGQVAREMHQLGKELSRMLSVIDLSKETGIIKELEIKKDTIILVRPDRYIGLITDEGVKVVRDYLHKLSVAKKEDDLFKLPKIHE
jgi:2-polyprenyl-6-methoxyphenol hydroxylase-like FAD-dependent oxidoreductase